VLLDVSRPLSPRTPAWPRDAPLRSVLTSRLGAHAANVSCITLSAHLGTHVDAPWHVLADGATVDRLPLDAFLGPARVVDARGWPRVDARALDRARGAERVLFRTRDADEPGNSFRGFAPLDAALCAELARRGVRLVGTDAPSVDAPDAAGLPAHRALALAGIPVVEGLDLAGAEPGDYEFLGLPLRLEGLDASPVRAALRKP
jgi:arylformamidase